MTSETTHRTIRPARPKAPKSSSDLPILPCPFCGKQPEAFLVGDNNEAEMIECMTSGCVAPHVSYYGKNEARKRWNRREATEGGKL